MSTRARILPWLALAACFVPGVIVACNSDDQAPPGNQPDGIFDASYDGAFDANEDQNQEPYDANNTACTLSGGNDPVSLCVQKAALAGMHGEFNPDGGGVPAYWSIDDNVPAEDGGAIVHDYRDDVGYGAALAAYFSASMVYGDTDLANQVSLDIGAIAKVVEAELATLPADYDGLTYLRLRRFAAGLRLTNWPQDAFAIDTIAAKYGQQIYTTYYHPLTGATGAGATDAGGDADDGSATDDAGGTGPTDAGVVVDGILGVAAENGYAYDSDRAAAGALALLDMASRALSNTVYPAPLPEDAGPDLTDGGLDFDAADAAPPPDSADSALWANAALTVFAHLDARARDVAGTGLYYGSLVTGGSGAHDTVADDGSFTTDVQGGVSLALLRGSFDYTSALAEPGIAALAAKGQALLNALHATTPSLWDPTNTDVTAKACSTAAEDASAGCGSGFFSSINGTELVTTKSIRGNAFLYGALHLASATAEKSDVIPLRALFDTRVGEYDSFFTQVLPQESFLKTVSATFNFVGANEAGVTDPLSQYYSAAATVDAIEGMDVQWVGVSGAPPIFQ